MVGRGSQRGLPDGAKAGDVIADLGTVTLDRWGVLAYLESLPGPTS